MDEAECGQAHRGLLEPGQNIRSVSQDLILNLAARWHYLQFWLGRYKKYLTPTWTIILDK